SLASITALSPEPHILLMVVHGTPAGTPAPSAACRAGACPSPAGSTHPMITSEISAGLTPAAPMAARAAAAPSCGAVSGGSAPWKAPIGVRLAATTYTSSWLMVMALEVWLRSARQRAVAARPARRARRQRRIVGAWAQAAFKHGHEGIGDLRRGETLVLAVPV